MVRNGLQRLELKCRVAVLIGVEGGGKNRQEMSEAVLSWPIPKPGGGGGVSELTLLCPMSRRGLRQWGSNDWWVVLMRMAGDDGTRLRMSEFVLSKSASMRGGWGVV